MISEDERPARGNHVVAQLSGVAAIVGFLAIGLLLALRWPILLRLDQGVEQATHQWMLVHLGIRSAVVAVTDAGSPISIAVLTAVVVVGLLVLRRVRPAVYLGVILLLEFGVETVTKRLIARPRPVLANPISHASGFSFPSGHAAATAVLLMGALAVWLPARTAVVRVMLAGLGMLAVAAVAASRVSTGRALPQRRRGRHVVGDRLRTELRPVAHPKPPTGHDTTTPRTVPTEMIIRDVTSEAAMTRRVPGQSRRVRQLRFSPGLTTRRA